MLWLHSKTGFGSLGIWKKIVLYLGRQWKLMINIDTLNVYNHHTNSVVIRHLTLTFCTSFHLWLISLPRMLVISSRAVLVLSLIILHLLVSASILFSSFFSSFSFFILSFELACIEHIGPLFLDPFLKSHHQYNQVGHRWNNESAGMDWSAHLAGTHFL